MELPNFLMTPHLFLFCHDIVYAHILLHVAQKNCCVNGNNSSHRSSVATKIMRVKEKLCFGNIKNYVTPKREIHVY